MATTNPPPAAIAQAYANNGDKAFPIAAVDAGTNVASMDKGIPAVCSEPLDTTGLPVRRTDVNALGFLATSLNYFMQNGGAYTFDANVSTAIGGYALDAKLWATLGGESVLVRSLKNNNTDNFVTTPAFIGNGTSWAIDLPYNNQLPRYIHVTHEEDSGTDGGTFTSGAWRVRPLNTLKSNTIVGASLAGNKITLPAGTYKITASAVALEVGIHKALLYNASTLASIEVGTNADVTIPGLGSDQVSTAATVNIPEITFSSSTDIELHHRCTHTTLNKGFGSAATFGVKEKYADVVIEQLAY